MLSPSLLQQIALARVILFGVVGLLMLCAFVRATQRNLWLWALAIGVAWAIGAMVILFPSQTLFWGNQGDETFQIAFMERVVSGEPFKDFFYAHLPPFYPPLYFWIFGSLGRLFSWNGIDAAQWGTVLTYAFLPFVALVFAKISHWTREEQQSTIFLSVGMLLFLPMDALLLKPYEVAAALLSVLWITGFTKAWRQQHGPTLHDALVLGFFGGGICLLYYFWFILLIPAMICLIIRRDSLRLIPKRATFLALTSICVATITAPFILPYLKSIITLGQENYQALYFFPTDIRLFAPWGVLSIAGLISLGSIATYLQRKTWTAGQVGSAVILASIMFWHLVQLVVLASGGKSVMVSKPFLFLGSIALFFPAAEWISEHLPATPFFSAHPRRTLIAAIIVLAPFLPNGLFLNDPRVQTQLEDNHLPKTSRFVADNIKTFIPDYANRLWLISGLQDLNGLLPLKHYLVWNPHFSHPAVHWGSRLHTLEQIASLSSATELTQAFDTLGINALLFYKTTDEQGRLSYPFFYQADAWPNGTENKELPFSPDLFSTADWQTVHEDNDWIFLIRRASDE